MQTIEETQKEDFVPRFYQSQMKDVCIAKNTIVYLPTGAGKTHIALMAIRELGRRGHLEKPLSQGGKRTFFIVNTVALAKQQAEMIGRNVVFKTSVYTSDRDVDTWKQDRWLEEFAKYQIIVCTCQILLDVLKHGYLAMSHINLLVFDECHHGVGDHPMHGIMEQYLRARKEDRPRVIGLSGMLLYKELKMKEQVAQELERLENTFDSTIATVGSYDAYTEVCRFSTDPKEGLLSFHVVQSSDVMRNLQGQINDFINKVALFDLPKLLNQNKSLMRDMPKPKKMITKYFKELNYQFEDLGLFGGAIALLGLIVQFELDKRESDHTMLRLLYRSCITFCENLRHQLENVMQGLEIKKKLTLFSSIKARQLIAQLEGFYKEGRSRKTKTLIFVQRRFSAKVVYHLLKIYFSETENAETILPDFMVGCNGTMPESIEQILSAKKDRRVLERFKKNETNVIVTTNVLEEGIDLQMCNSVIKFDYPETFASYEQSKGRARMKDSTYTVMLDSDKREKFLKKYVLYKEIEEELRRALVGKTINRPEPLEADVTKELTNELIPPFYTKKGAKLDALSSIQLLNRYCMGMPRDAFTNTNVTWERNNDKYTGKIVVAVLLPLQSTVRDKVFGQPMTNVKLAKRSAAFEACRKLYEAGELNDHLIPIDSKRQLANVSEVYFRHWKQFEEESAKQAGTQKNVRNHQIRYPSQTSGCCPQPGKPCYIYVLRIAAGFNSDVQNENIETFHTLYSSENNFGIMTTKPLPVLARMKFFVSLGLINVHLDPTPIRVENAGSDADLAALKQFQLMLFRDVLRLWKEFLVLDSSNEANSFLVVPLAQSRQIDWQVVKDFPFLAQPSELSTVARSRMVFDAKQYRHRVILPWYRTDRERAYVVTAVHEHLTPGSPFPNEKYQTYEDYFGTVYGQQICNKNQFLIEVKGITTWLNRLSPGDQDDGKSATRAKNWTFHEILIPELCHNFAFPADYWLKATLLPSALHRINFLLLAENIRVELATEANVGCLECRTVEDVDVEYKNRKSTDLANGMDELKFDSDEDEEDDDDDFDYEEAKKALVGPEDLNSLMRIQMNSFAEEVEMPWKEQDEPVDIERNWDNVSALDLDYYDSFVRKFSSLNVGEQITTKMAQSYSSVIHKQATRGSPQKVAGAILDMSLDEKFRIALLKLTPENTVYVPLQQCAIIKALTTKSAHDVYDLERYELLGDAFLKFSVSLFLVKKHKEWHEGHLTAVKGQLVSNRNLLYCAMLINLPGMMKIHTFDPKNDWSPPLASVPHAVKQKMASINHSARVLYKLKMSEEEIQAGTIEKDKYEDFIAELDVQSRSLDTSPMQNYLSQQAMGDKMPADSMEAMLGVCVSTVGIKRSFRLLSFLGILPKKENLTTLLDDRIANQRLKADVTKSEVDSFLISPGRIERILDYTFKDRTYLLQALTHASYPTNRITGSYQQLEFVGDAVLDFLISAYIYEQNPTMSPGQLTDLRSALVNNITLACILVRHGLHLYILSESASLTDTVSKFVAFQEAHKHEITDQVNLLSEESERCQGTMAEFVDVPKALGDVFESLIGAVFLDSGNDLEATWRVIYGLMHHEIATFSVDTPIQIVRRLYEWKPPCYPKFSQAIVDDDTVLVKLRYRIRNVDHEAYGFGQNKEDAKRAAAKAAIQKLRKQ